MKNNKDKNFNMGQDDHYLDDSVVSEDNIHAELVKIKEKLKQCEAERLEYLAGWQRAKADLINARKRDEADRQEFIKFANERLIEDLIPVLESFDFAVSNKETWEKVDANWRTGVEYIHNQLRKVLADSGLTEINPIGQTFDPMRDEASEYISVDSKDEHHKIVAVIQKGYALNGKDIRPPKVKVGEYK